MGERIHRFFEHNEKNQRLGEDWDPNKKLSPEPQEAKPQLPAQGQMDATGAMRSSSSRLFLSLLSGLPNEQEFALHVCSLLSCEGPLILTPRMLEVLVAQAGVWQTEDGSLGLLYSESWRDLEGRNMRLFWRRTLHPHDVELFRVLGLDLGECGEESGSFWNLDSNLGSLNAEGQRVLKVALILHNSSFEKDNVPVLVNSTIFIRFLLLSIHSSWANLKQMAFDTLANIASEVRLCVERDSCTLLLLRSVLEGLSSPDRFVGLRSMDVLSQLCGRTPNDELIPARLDTQIYERMVSFLTVPDIMLLFYTLEALYALSDLGKLPCDRIACVHGSISVLVNLLTLDPAQYGPSAEIKMKIVEVLVPAEPGDPLEDQVVVSSSPSEAPAVASSTVSVSAKDVNSETFANNWLKSHYEMFPGSLISRNEIYAEYVSFCTKAERKGVVNANVFANCVKGSFPHVELKKVQSSGGVITFHHDGLRRRRTTANPVTQSPKPTVAPVTVTCASVAVKPLLKPVQSPILQAQLSAPAKPSEAPAKLTTVASSQSPASPFVISSPQNSSTLIKSLLANKVQQRTVQQQQRQVVPLGVQRQVILHQGSPQGLSKMVIFSPGKGMRCVMPQVNLQGTRLISATPQQQSIKVLQTPAVQLNGMQGDSVCSKSSSEVPTPILQMNCIQNNLSSDPHTNTTKDFISGEVSGNLQSLKDVTASSDQSFILSQIQGNTITYRLAGPEELALSSGNRLFLRSKPTAEAPTEQNGVFLNNKGQCVSVVAQPHFIQPKNPPDTTKSVLCRADTKPLLKKEDICKKSPLLNGLLDRGRPPSGDILFNALVENGIEASDVGLELSKGTSPVQSLPPQTKNNPSANSIIIPSSSLNSFILPASSDSATASLSNSLIQSKLGKSEVSLVTSESTILSPKSAVVTTTCLNSILLNSTPSPAFTVAPSLSSTNGPSLVNRNSGSSLVRIRSGHSMFSGTAQLQADQAGVVRLHIESPENSNQGSSDLSSLSDIARTLECASEAISRTNAECNTQVPRTPVTFAVNNAVVGNSVRQGGGVNMALKTVEGNVVSHSSVASLVMNTNTVADGILGQGGAATLAVNSVAGNIITHSGAASLSMNTVAGSIMGQGSPATLAMNTVSGNIIHQGGAATFAVNTVAGNIISQGGAASQVMNTLAGNIISQGNAATLAVNTVAGGIVSQGGVATLGRPNQQIFVVTSPALGQSQNQSPNIKFCILHTVPMTEESGGDLVGLPQIGVNHMQETSSSTVSLKRPSSDPVCIVANVKKPRIDAAQQPITGHVDVERPSTPKVSSARAVPVPGLHLPSEREAKTFSGLTSAGGNDLPPPTMPSKTHPSTKLEFVCEWKSCGLKFLKPGQVFLHASRVHTPATVEALPCLWEGCDNMKRRRFSLLTHLQDWHCNERVLQVSAARRLHLQREGQSPLAPPPKPPPHPGYAPDAAVLAIKRHALQYNNPKELAEEKERPLTKSIRLTSALILRNLVMHSSLARTYVRRFEAELAYLAMSPVESAKAIAQCLSYLSASSTRD